MYDSVTNRYTQQLYNDANTKNKNKLKEIKFLCTVYRWKFFKFTFCRQTTTLVVLGQRKKHKYALSLFVNI